MYKIGVDGGGSKTHAVLVSEIGNIIDEVYAGSANIASDTINAISSITAVIDQLVIKHKLKNNEYAIGIGVAGYSVHNARKTLLQALKQKYSTCTIQDNGLHRNSKLQPNTIKLSSDCHIACLAAHNGNDGAIVICGTGVVGYYITNQTYNQIGGWGFPHGDLGGGAWLGLELAKLLCRAIDGIIDFTPNLKKIYASFDDDRDKYFAWLLKANAKEYASLVKLVFSDGQLIKNSEGVTNGDAKPTEVYIDKQINKLVHQGANEVVQIIEQIIKIDNNLPIQISGGLSDLYLPHIQKSYPKITKLGMCPSHGATLL